MFQHIYSKTIQAGQIGGDATATLYLDDTGSVDVCIIRVNDRILVLDGFWFWFVLDEDAQDILEEATTAQQNATLPR